MNFRGSRLGFWFRRRPATNNVLVFYQDDGQYVNGDLNPLTDIWPTIRDEELIAGNIPELIVGYQNLPASFSQYSHVWDIGYNSPFIVPGSPAVFPADAMLTYLQQGGAFCVIGDNSFFLTRDDSISAFITNIGGGNVILSEDSFVAQWNVFIQPNFLIVNQASLLALDSPGAFTAAGIGTGTPWTSALLDPNPPIVYPIVCWEEGSLSNETEYNMARGGPPLNGTVLAPLDVNIFNSNSFDYSSNAIQNMIATLDQR